MAVIKPEEISPEEERHEVIAAALVGNAPAIPGFSCVRHVTPLVMVALQRANNPYITGKRGFTPIGIEFGEEGEQLTSATVFMLAMMPKTAEVIVLLSCTREELKKYSVDPAALEDAALDIVETSTKEQLAQATIFVSEQLEAISASRADKSPEGEKPTSSALEEGGDSPKKLAPTG